MFIFCDGRTDTARENGDHLFGRAWWAMWLQKPLPCMEVWTIYGSMRRVRTSKLRMGLSGIEPTILTMGESLYSFGKNCFFLVFFLAVHGFW